MKASHAPLLPLGRKGGRRVMGVDGAAYSSSLNWGHNIQWANHLAMGCSAVSLLEFLKLKAFCSRQCNSFKQESLDGKPIK